MDMSKLVWVFAIIAVIVVGWLLTSGGTEFMYKQYTESTPGVDEAQDKRDEAGLTRLGGYLLRTFRYERASEVYEAAIKRYPIDLYPDSEHYYMNIYNQSKAYEKMDEWEKAADNLMYLRDVDADQYDERVPNFDQLNGELMRIVEVHELPLSKYNTGTRPERSE